MAKNNENKRPEEANGSAMPPAAYFKSLTIENVKCFKGEHTIDLSDGNGKPAQWTVILGNNNTGKTTILKCLAGLEAKEGFLIVSDPSTQGQEVRMDTLYPFLFLNDKIGTNPDSLIGSKFYIYNLSESPNEKSTLLTNRFELYNKEWKVDRKQKHYVSASPKGVLRNLIIYAFGTSRKMDLNQEVKPSHSNLSNLLENAELVDSEDWILTLSHAGKLGQIKALKDLTVAKNILTNGILPDVTDLQIRSEEKGAGFENFLEFKTDFGWIRLRELGYGYQTMIAWVLDLVKRMIERYPNSPNPLAEPAIVLVDEIDLHLHPDWQRKIIAHLTKHFPNTQFIVTAHSPLVVQSADEVNVVILKKDGDSVHIEQPKLRTFKGWTVEEILTDLMQLEGQTMSQTYIDLREQFDEALDEDDFAKAKDAYDELVKILHPTSTQRKLMQLQMTSLSPETTL